MGLYTIRQQTDALQHVLDDNRFEYVQLSGRQPSCPSPKCTKTYLELTTSTGNADSGLVAHDLRRDHRDGLTLRGVDLSGHDAATRFVLRQADFAKATSRSRSQETNVVGYLHQ